MNRGDDFPDHSKMDYSDGWNVMRKTKESGAFNSAALCAGQKEHPRKEGTASEMINSIPYKCFLS